MSLDVSLMGPARWVECRCPECGNTHERQDRDCYFDANITHNLGKMAAAAGIYNHLWRPDEIGVFQASELIAPLRDGLAKMKADPDFYRGLEPTNKWGTYDNFLPWIEKYLKACEEHPAAKVEVSR